MTVQVTTAIPAQRRAGPDTLSVFEQGLVGGVPPLHATRPTLTGAKAVCGAGAITVRVPGRFSPDALPACPVCSAHLNPVTA